MIYLVRHGQTEFNREGRFQGALDSPLTPLGVEQGAALGRLIAEIAPRETPIVSSPQGRAVHTAGLIQEAGGFTGGLTIDDRLREISVGEWDGRLRSEIADTFPGPRPNDWFFHAPGAETFASMSERLGGWLAGQNPERAVICVSHGMSGRILRGLYGGLSREEMLALEVPQDAVFRLVEGIVQRFDCEPAD